MNKRKVPIFDKNGKATHVWKTDDNHLHSVERIPAQPNIAQPKNVLEEPLSVQMDKLWAAVTSTELAVTDLQELEQSAPSSDSAKAVGEVIDNALEAQQHIEDMEAELTAFEEADEDDKDEDWRDLYTAGVAEIRFQKSRLLGYLNDGHMIPSPIFSPRITRTWEAGVAAVEELYGNADVVQELPNGSSVFRFGKDDEDWREITVNRLGNVSRFNTPRGEFSAASIDFPVASANGDTVLRGVSDDGALSLRDHQSIVYISTGMTDTLIN